MAKIKVVEGEIYRDERGQISSLNAFRFSGVERCYFIHHPDTSVVRGWHGHQFEKKWFYCVKGSFTVALVEVDNWENPSPDLDPVLHPPWRPAKAAFHPSPTQGQLRFLCIGDGTECDQK